ncbi:unnamed protein product [Cylindrotheca closterium]|uniref:Uncharacterized protein n=1 Tax=Cylindrotheca closterium TaxID=2856 RepID=A0AAD2FVX7_9STRA|nr:unnamed protein product [Cylindrotheca closterium]
MLRRTAASSSTPSRKPSNNKRLNTATSRSKSNRNSNYSFLNPALAILLVAVIILGLSWYLFPSETLQVEKKLEQEAQYVGHRVAENAMNAEHNMEHWWQSRGSGAASADNNNNGNNGNDNPGMNAATARMMAQPSKWVDGEKALKKQLKELLAIQENGELLGVPVLTRYLGEDFPAWVGKDVNEEEWKQNVADKYKEMREEEDEWRKEMKKIIDTKVDLV